MTILDVLTLTLRTGSINGILRFFYFLLSLLECEEEEDYSPYDIDNKLMSLYRSKVILTNSNTTKMLEDL